LSKHYTNFSYVWEHTIKIYLGMHCVRAETPKKTLPIHKNTNYVTMI